MKSDTALVNGCIYSEKNAWIRERRPKHRHIVFRRKQMTKFLLGFCTGIAFVLFILHFMTGPASDAASASHKVICSVYIEQDDTLWSIAKDYYTRECGSMQEYVQEIKDTNRLSGDGIHAGGYLVVPYYVMD